MTVLRLIAPDSRIVTLPHTDAWMAGDRYGTVTKVGRKWVHVDMDRSGRTRKFLIEGDDDRTARVLGIQLVSEAEFHRSLRALGRGIS